MRGATAATGVPVESYTAAMRARGATRDSNAVVTPFVALTGTLSLPPAVDAVCEPWPLAAPSRGDRHSRFCRAVPEALKSAT